MSEKEPSYITQSNRMCEENGMNPDDITYPKVVMTTQELASKRKTYGEILAVVSFFSNKLLNSLQGNPILIVISDSEGYLLDMVGDETIKATVEQLGIKIGCLFSQKDMGTNVVSLTLEQQKPVKLIGENHYHKHLYETACYGAPFHYTDENNLLGSVCIMMPVMFQNPLFLSMLTQVVDSIERELLLRKQNQTLNILNQILLSRSRNGIVITDESGIITKFNDMAQSLLNISKNFCMRYCIFDCVLIGDYFRRVIELEEIVENVELKVKNSTGEETVCLFDAQPIYENAKVVGSFGKFRDITERSMMEDKIKEAEKQVLAGQIAAGIAHEIRNPLTTVRGYLQFLENDADEKTAQLFSSLLIPEIDRVNKIISDFLSIAKPSSKEFEIITVQHFLHDYLLKFLESEALLYNIIINVKIDPATKNLLIHCNREELLQVFINLFQNSLQAKGNHQLKININTNLINDCVQFIFIDNGKGINASDLAHIFEPFFSTKDIGTGLGLSISQKIIVNHNGTINATSNESGTVFIIELPILNL